MEIHLQAEGVEDGEQRGELGIPLATLSNHPYLYFLTRASSMMPLQLRPKAKS